MTEDDAPFWLKLLNEPSYHQNIGDRGVRTLEDCKKYLREKILTSYGDHGMGVFMIELISTGEIIGFSTLLKRDSLEVTDLGYAFAPAHWGRGYATEASLAVKEYCREVLKLRSIGGVVDPRNTPSIRVLQKLGMHLAGRVRFRPEDIELELYVCDL